MRGESSYWLPALDMMAMCERRFAQSSIDSSKEEAEVAETERRSDGVLLCVVLSGSVRF